ncbi:restriction endonuclease subunit S [Macrococcoides caseolyticum]|uniref:restriction endonuclease subunit S n=1 Tax=Macrococcoides caseolyticum TaxID=69966 RepID=UPI000C32C229|nr:restriction endonuclease subunit S [Macrococcus caseolyticus]PKE49865.1 hypothetical protein CW672_07725 [Macrococcus caseolyticus]
MEQINTEALKKKILDLAIRGKLVEQDPNDEPASVLLEKIRVEKEELIQQKKIKRNKNESYIFKGDDGLYYEKFQDGTVKSIQDEIPFEVPEGWEWVRLSNVLKIIFGQSPKSDKVFDKYNKNTIEFHQGKSNFQNKIIGISNKYADISSKIAEENSIVMSVRAPVGDINFTDRKITIGRGLCALKPISLKTDIDYIYSFLSTQKSFLESKATGTTFKSINSDQINNILVPFPPLNEQIKISSNIDLIFEMINEISTLQNELFKLNNKVKQLALNLAMQGKLIPQDPNDEPASVLLEKIKEEKEKLIKEGKIKRNKKESAIIRRGESYYELLDGKEKDITNEIPFEIPEKWMWIRLRDIAKEIKAGGDRPTEVSKIKNEIYQYPIYSNGSKNKGLYGYSKRAIIKESAITISARGTIGYSEIRQPNFTPIVRLICILLNTKFIDIKYINYVFNLLISPQEGTSIPQLTVPNIREKLIPLPPNKEQMKISIILDKLKEV